MGRQQPRQQQRATGKQRATALPVRELQLEGMGPKGPTRVATDSLAAMGKAGATVVALGRGFSCGTVPPLTMTGDRNVM